MSNPWYGGAKHAVRKDVVIGEDFQYAPEIFETEEITAAMAAILAPEAGLSPEQRWELETAWLVERMIFPPEASLVDYGCGIGRLSKALPQSNILGVDITASMRAMAPGYVGKPGFRVITPAEFRSRALTMDVQGAVCVWILQHIPEVDAAIDDLAAALRPGSFLYAANRDNRSIPVSDGWSFTWADDGKDVDASLARRFVSDKRWIIPDTLCAPGATLTRWVRT